VTWRYSPDYIGWAPLGPGFSVYVTTYPVVYGWWTFVPCHRFVGVPVHSVAFGGHHVRGIFHGTHPAPPRAAVFGARAPAWGGPARPFVEQRLGHAIAPVRVQPVGSPAAIASARPAGVVPIYRPEARVHAPRAPSSGHGVLPPPAQSRGSGAARPAPGNALRGGGPSVAGQPAPRTPAPGSPGMRTAPAPAQGGFRGPANQGGGPAMRPQGAPRPAPSAPRGSLAPSRDGAADPGRAHAFASPRPERSFAAPRAPQGPGGQGGFARPQAMLGAPRPERSFAAPRAPQGGSGQGSVARPQGAFGSPRVQGGFSPPRVQSGGGYGGVRAQPALPRGGGAARAPARHR
jgi:hypothetical protein